MHIIPIVNDEVHYNADMYNKYILYPCAHHQLCGEYSMRYFDSSKWSFPNEKQYFICYYNDCMV